jgi:RNA ligase (TIGR02306 family)
MSDFKVPYTTITKITPHAGADRLEVAHIYGFQVVVPKGRYEAGSPVIYAPIDSVLPASLEAILFPPDSKIKLHKSRIRQIRIRGLASQGMVIDPHALVKAEVIPYTEALDPEQNLAETLGVTKYEPPAPGFAQTIGKDKQKHRKVDNPLFHKYNGLDNIKWFPDLFAEGEEVVIQEKLHGTNARASILPFVANTLWKRILKFLRLAPKYEQCYGSNNVEISARGSYKGFYGTDVYGATFKALDVFSKLRPGETVYGEIIGPGIQKNYDYGLKETRFVLFDVKVLCPCGKQVWLKPDEVMDFAKERGFELVPCIYIGAYSKEKAYALTKGSSAYCPTQKVREGIVIKAQEGYDVEGNKKALKWISEDYLDDKSNTDFH